MIMLTMWAYIGVEFVTVPAEDVIEPRRTIPRALIAGTLTVTLVYILATSGVMALIPVEELVLSTSPFADAAARIVGGWGTTLVALGAIISILGAMNANVLVCGMMPRAVAIDRLFPRAFARLNERGAPAFALIVSGALASVLVALNFTRGLVAAFELLILLATLTTLLPFAASALSELVLLKRDAATSHAVDKKSVGIAAGALGFAIFAIVGSGVEAALYGLLLLAAGVPVYLRHSRQSTGGRIDRHDAGEGGTKNRLG
jgi:APA family basic amino acid/polyamine antiporter